MGNEELKEVYDTMHKKGVTSWFSDGKEERETILKMGEPWCCPEYEGADWFIDVLEIGCGEGDLYPLLIEKVGVTYGGIDYSEVAIKKAREKHHIKDPVGSPFYVSSYRDWKEKVDRIVMQGVLEHLDNPFVELKWMIDNLLVKGGDVITSSPCFLNPRGIVWMTLDMLGAVMSKTDLHFLGPKPIELFCIVNGYKLSYTSCDFDWAGGEKMYQDLNQRIPLALRDGNIPYDKKKFDSFMLWLGDLHEDIKPKIGATMVYKIST